MERDTNKKVFEFLKNVNGQGPVQLCWTLDYSYLALCGENRNVIILDKYLLQTHINFGYIIAFFNLNRRGKKIKELPLQHNSKVASLSWDRENEFLCILQKDLPLVSIWNVFVSNTLIEVDVSNPKEKATFALWSKTHPVLAIGTDKGSIVFYFKKQQKKIPTVGKHTKKVISGDWNKEGLLITGGEDKFLSVSDDRGGSPIESVTVKAEPKMLSWGKIKTDDRDTQQRTVIAVLNMKSILMFEIGGQIQPLELILEAKYGDIVNYSLFGDGYIVVGFSKGWVAHISTHMKELKEEVSSEKVFNNTLDNLCTNDLLYKMAVAGEGTIKFYNMSTWKEIKNERITLPSGIGRVDKMVWTPNGQILTITTQDGHIFGFLTSQPNLTSCYAYYSALLTSFTEITLFDCSKVGGVGPIISTVNIEMEPGFISNGPFHVASGINNMVWYYRWLEPKKRLVIPGGQLVLKRDYFSSVKDVKLSKEWAAVLTDGICFLHPIEEQNSERDKRFPGENEKPIICIGLTDNFLIMLDATGRIKYFHLQDSLLVMEYKADTQITKFYVNSNGSKLVCADTSGTFSVFLAPTEHMIPIQDFPAKVERIIWDVTDSNQFITVEGDTIQSFQVSKYNLGGISCASVKEMLTAMDIHDAKTPFITKLDKGLKPMIVTDGYLFSLNPGGTVQGNYLASHSYLPLYKAADDNNEGHLRYFLQNLALKRYSYCLVAASFIIDNEELYEALISALGRKALENLELELAYTCYQRLQNLSMCLFIDSFKHESETNILYGNIAMIFGQYDQAQEFFLKSSKPVLALDMRSDIQDWLVALNLAKNIAPEKEPLICRRLATQIESQGNPAEALRLYEKAMLSPEKETLLEKSAIESHNFQCMAGIARTSVKLGDVSRGYSIAFDLKDNQQIIEIAMVCENAKHLLEAGQLYEKACLFEKAASIYISLKLFKQVYPLLSKLKSPKLLMQLAKAKEAEGSYKEAEAAYERAEDWENVIKINLSYLSDPEKAKWVLRNKCPTQTCAMLLAAHCDKKGPKSEAIEFYLLAGRKEDAFNIAVTQNLMADYAQFATDLSSEEALRIAQYFEGKSEFGKAAIYYEKSGNVQKALKLFLQGGDDFLEKAIELVARVKQEPLTRKLIDALTEDATPKDPIWLFRLYMALGNIKQAATVAITIANQEQESGNYKPAHTILFQTTRDLRNANFPVPYDLHQKLMILHSYLSVKRLVKMNDHEDAARLLDRVCKNISQFPAHDVTILTSAVVQATRANLKATAFNWAKVLMQNEYRNKIAANYKNKIETVARRPITEELEDKKTGCPFCGNLVDEFLLHCDGCNNTIPYCIVTGKHIILEDCTFDPKSGFPASYSAYLKAIEVEPVNPMTGEEVSASELTKAYPDEVRDRIKKKKNLEEKKDEKSDASRAEESKSNA